MRQPREAVINGSPVEERPAHRPPIFDVPLTRTVKIYMTEDQYLDLQNVAAAEQKSKSTVIRDAVDSYVGDFRERRMFFVGKKYQPE